MPLRFVPDENLRGLMKALQAHNRSGGQVLDALRVGDPPDLPLGSDAAAILLWAEREGRILLTLDANTMPGYLTSHLQANHHSPGMFLLRPNVPTGMLLAFLEMVAYTSNPVDWQDRIEYVP